VITDESRWWTKKGAVHEQVWALVRRIETDQAGRRSRLKSYRDLYLDQWQGRDKRHEGHVSFNGIRSGIDTVCAKIAKNKPAITVLTSGGDYQQKKKAKQLGKFIDGTFREMNFHEKAQLVFRDACVYDGGALKFYADPDAEKVRCERVMVNEILVDRREAYYGSPRQLFHRRAAHRDVLAALYPRKKAWIMEAQPASLDWMMEGIDASDAMVDVVESWHLPSAEGAKDGRHVICINGATLYDQPYTHADFPFVFFRWQEPLEGFWMPGLAQETWGLQAELNSHLESIRQSHALMGHPVIFIPTGSKINSSDLTSEIGTIIEGDSPPVPIIMPTMDGRVYDWSQTLKQWIYEAPGVSQTSAKAQKPSGVESGAAIREVNDIESERFMLVGQRYESLYMRAAEWTVRIAREMYDDGVDIGVRARDRRFLESIKWSEVDMDDDSFELAMFPTSSLPTQPAGRIQTIVDLATNGLIDQKTARELLDLPDLESSTELELAPVKLIEKMLDEMIDGEDYQAPDPTMDLVTGASMGLRKLQWARAQDGIDEPTLDKIRLWVAECTDMLKPKAPAPSAAAVAADVTGPVLPAADMPPLPDPATLDGTMPPMPAVA
jgi:hypothetical protein